MLPLYSGRDHQRGIGIGRRGPQRGYRGGRMLDGIVDRIVDLLVVERQLPQPLEHGDGDAVRSDLRRQLGDLAVDRRRAQAAHQRQDLDVGFSDTVPFPSVVGLYPCTTKPDHGPVYSGRVKVQV